MNTKQKKTTAATAVTAGVVVGTVIGWRSLEKQVIERFPQVDPKIARKAFRRMIRKSLTQQYQNLDNASDAVMDGIFMREVNYLSRTTK